MNITDSEFLRFFANLLYKNAEHINCSPNDMLVKWNKQAKIILTSPQLANVIASVGIKTIIIDDVLWIVDSLFHNQILVTDYKTIEISVKG